MKENGIEKIDGKLVGVDGKWEKETLPGGWTWDDIGNYYGAGTSALNWRENQYDLLLQSGPVAGGSVSIVGRRRPQPYHVALESEVAAAEKGSGDKTSIYLAPFSAKGVVRGTIPVDQKAFVISGSFPDPSLQLISTFAMKLDSAKMGAVQFSVSEEKQMPVYKTLHTQLSPTLDSLNYWS